MQNSTIKSGKSSDVMQEKNNFISPQVQVLQNQRKEYITSDENIVALFVISPVEEATQVAKEALFKT